jgi:TRAP-type C4-dicarboxylate transport system permease small subunit
VKAPATGMHRLAHHNDERQGSRFTLLNRLELILGALLLGLIVVMVLWQAISRYFPEYNWIGSGELARYALVAMTFLLVGHLFGAGQHITITILDSSLTARGLSLLRTLAAVFVVVIAGAFVWGAIGLLMDPFTWSRVTSAVRLSNAYIVMIPLAGFALMVLRAVEVIVRQSVRLRRGEF